MELFFAVSPISLLAQPSEVLVFHCFLTGYSFTLRKISYTYKEEEYQVASSSIIGLSLVVGIIEGIYGIGGGAIIAPFCVAIMNIPVHTVAGAAMFGTSWAEDTHSAHLSAGHTSVERVLRKPGAHLLPPSTPRPWDAAKSSQGPLGTMPEGLSSRWLA